MDNAVLNYTFTVIEDTKVPLAAGISNSVSYIPVIVAIVVMAVVACLVGYTVWFMSHKSYIADLVGKADSKLNDLYIHPIKLLQLEYEIENRIADQYIA